MMTYLLVKSETMWILSGWKVEIRDTLTGNSFIYLAGNVVSLSEDRKDSAGTVQYLHIN